MRATPRVLLMLFLTPVFVACQDIVGATDEDTCEPGTHEVRLRELTVVGMHHLPSTELDNLREALRTKLRCAYIYDLLLDTQLSELTARLRDLWQRHGHLKAVFWPVKVEWHKDGDATALDVSLRVEEGPRLTLAAIAWRNVTLFPEQRLTELFPIGPGEVFDVGAIRRGLEAVRELYADQGYVNFTTIPDTEVDEASASIFLTIEVEEGPRFAFGELELLGLDGELRDVMLAAWSKLQGAPFRPRQYEYFLEPFERKLPAYPEMRHVLNPAEVHVCINASREARCFANLASREEVLRPTLRRRD